jgi:ferrochelatase
MKHKKTGILVVNLGTPDHHTVPHVRKYLREFLMDGRVIDIPHFKRWLLVNLIIAPFRAPKSAKVYQQLWTENGSPLLFYGEEIEKKLQSALGDEFIVKLGMRYQNPSIKTALGQLKKSDISSLIVLPLFPQYASATTGSIHQDVMEHIKGWENIPELHFINSYCNDKDFIKAFAERSREVLKDKDFDLMLFSYHGLPERQVLKASVNNFCKLNDCCATYGTHNQFCYRAQCYETTRLLARELGITEDKYQIVFQSRLGKSPWIQPYADEVISSLPSKGIKKVAVMMPSFVADCLETIVEVGSEFREIFEKAGGEEWIFIESLNDSKSWIETLEKLIRKNLK